MEEGHVKHAVRWLVSLKIALSHGSVHTNCVSIPGMSGLDFHFIIYGMRA